MKLIMEPAEVVRFQKVRFGVLLFLGIVWAAVASVLLLLHPREFLLRVTGFLALIFIILYFIIFPFWGAADARRIIRAHESSTANVQIDSSTLLAVVVTVFIVYAVFPREVALLSGGIAGYVLAFLLGAGNVFGSYKFTDRIIKWFGNRIFSKSRGTTEGS